MLTLNRNIFRRRVIRSPLQLLIQSRNSTWKTSAPRISSLSLKQSWLIWNWIIMCKSSCSQTIIRSIRTVVKCLLLFVCVLSIQGIFFNGFENKFIRFLYFIFFVLVHPVDQLNGLVLQSFLIKQDILDSLVFGMSIPRVKRFSFLKAQRTRIVLRILI